MEFFDKQGSLLISSSFFHLKGYFNLAIDVFSIYDLAHWNTSNSRIIKMVLVDLFVNYSIILLVQRCVENTSFCLILISIKLKTCFIANTRQKFIIWWQNFLKKSSTKKLINRKFCKSFWSDVLDRWIS